MGGGRLRGVVTQWCDYFPFRASAMQARYIAIVIQLAIHVRIT